MDSVEALASVVRESRMGKVENLGDFDAQIFGGCGYCGVFVGNASEGILVDG